MRDFNDLLAKDRQFKVQDQVFTWRDVKPEVLTAFDAGTDDPDKIWEVLDAQILLFLDPADDAHARWKKLRAREDSPVTIAQLNAILTWLMEEQTGRPTEPPSPSASGRGRTAASSKVG